jgi:hypothetical protein
MEWPGTPDLQYSSTPVPQYFRIPEGKMMAKKTESSARKEKAGKEPLPKDTGPGTKIRKFTQEFLRHLFYTLEGPSDPCKSREVHDRIGWILGKRTVFYLEVIAL